MNKWQELSMMTLALIVTAIFGVWMSKSVRNEDMPWYFMYISGFTTVTVWAWQANSKILSLAMASVMFDVVYNGAWFLAMVAMGEPYTWKQGIGIAIILVGLVFLA